MLRKMTFLNLVYIRWRAEILCPAGDMYAELISPQ